MSVTNFEIFQIAIRSLDPPDREEIEREVTDRYERTIATSGLEMAEALARSETLAVLLQLDFEGGAYLRSHLR